MTPSSVSGFRLPAALRCTRGPNISEWSWSYRVKQGGARPSRARPAEVRRKVALSSFARIEPLSCGRALLDVAARLSIRRPACPTVLACDPRLLPNTPAQRSECGMSCRSAIGDDFAGDELRDNLRVGLPAGIVDTFRDY